MEKVKGTLKNRLRRDMARNWSAYLMVMPAIVFIVLFAYVPMYGILIAFQDYSPILGVLHSPWIGWENFIRFFSGRYTGEVILNTFAISILSLIFGFPCPVIFALLLNSLKCRRFVKSLQMVSYAPYFISVVVVVGMLQSFLAPNTGIFNHIARFFGGTGMADPLSDAGSFRLIYIVSDIWQNLGWSSIIYICALSGVDPELYDSADIDGANILQKIRYIDVPSLAPTIVVLLILQSGSILNVGFEKVYLLQNEMNLQTSEVISTYVYKRGLLASNYGMGTAVGLCNSLISFTLLVAVNFIARRVSNYSLW